MDKGFKAPWEQKNKENDNIPESIRRPEGYVEPKKEAPKRDPEREKAEWERTPESVRKPQAYVDLDTFGLRDTIDKNVRFMTDEEIAAERAAEKAKRAEMLQPKEPKKEESKAAPKKDNHDEQHVVTSKADKGLAPKKIEDESRKYEILNASEMRERMKNFVSSDSRFSPEDRAEIEKRFNDPQIAEEMKNRHFLVGEVNGQSVMHLLSEQETEKFYLLEGKERDQYVVHLLESESKIQEQERHQDNKERERLFTQPQTAQQVNKNDISFALSPMEMIIRFLFNMFGMDFLNNNKQEMAQQQSSDAIIDQNQSTRSVSQLEPIVRPRSTEQHMIEVSNLQVKANGDNLQMVAIVNGKEESRQINDHDYNKFLALDDHFRLRLFNKIFGIPDGQSVRVADKIISAENDYNHDIKSSISEPEKRTQSQSWKNPDYATLASMNYENEMMKEEQHSQEQNQSTGIRR